jgi:hypothetical protein
LLGEQKVLSAVQLLPLVTVWPPKSHVHFTVSPTWIVTVLGLNTCPPLGATCTVTVCGPAPVHTPLWHVVPAAHAEPQPPQLALSVCSFTHAPAQGLKPLLHAVPHEVPSHVADPLAGPAGQAEHDVPHVAVDVLLTHVPLQSCVLPAWHLHWPLWHVLPPAHANAEPQPPQLALSVCSLTQAPVHGLKPVLHAVPHEVPLHVALPLVGPEGHAEHDVPHDAVDVLLTHVPPQSCVPLAWHLHWLLWHVLPPVHAAPQPPQFEVSLVISTHEVPHVIRPEAQADAQERVLPEPAHSGVPPEHAVVQLPQCAGTVISVSQPLSATVLQCAQPGVHAEGSKEHCPEAPQDTAPVT